MGKKTNKDIKSDINLCIPPIRSTQIGPKRELVAADVCSDGFRSGRGQVRGIKLLPARGGDPSHGARLEIDRGHRQAPTQESNKSRQGQSKTTFLSVQPKSRPLGKCRGADLPLIIFSSSTDSARDSASTRLFGNNE